MEPLKCSRLWKSYILSNYNRTPSIINIRRQNTVAVRSPDEYNVLENVFWIFLNGVLHVSWVINLEGQTVQTHTHTHLEIFYSPTWCYLHCLSPPNMKKCEPMNCWKWVTFHSVSSQMIFPTPGRCRRKKIWQLGWLLFWSRRSILRSHRRDSTSNQTKPNSVHSPVVTPMIPKPIPFRTNSALWTKLRKYLSARWEFSSCAANFVHSAAPALDVAQIYFE